MKTIKRKGGDIKIFAETIEDTALQQIEKLGKYEPYKNSMIRIMPDCHAGAGCTIGTTMVIDNKLTPNLVGRDVGCGMLTVKLSEKNIDLRKLDEVINTVIPSGYNVHDQPVTSFDFSNLRCQNHVNTNRAQFSLGTLGGGNHFIEVARGGDSSLYLIIHSGSRQIGGQMAGYYQDLAIKQCTINDDRDKIISQLKKEGREKEIQKELKKLKPHKVDKELAHLEGKLFDDYMNDMEIIQQFAQHNRATMAELILEAMCWKISGDFETIHNYIDFNRMVLRKGAVSAERGETLLIPINMRDGSLLCRGKGNPDWNFSACHGAGRLMSRTQARQNLSMKTFVEQMSDVYSTSVLETTLDEAPEAYKPIEEIMAAIKDTVDVLDILKPIYNFKAH